LWLPSENPRQETGGKRDKLHFLIGVADEVERASTLRE
jgi:hypothetical protein